MPFLPQDSAARDLRGTGQALPAHLMEERLMRQQQEMEEDQRWLEKEERFLVMAAGKRAPPSGPAAGCGRAALSSAVEPAARLVLTPRGCGSRAALNSLFRMRLSCRWWLVGSELCTFLWLLCPCCHPHVRA